MSLGFSSSKFGGNVSIDLLRKESIINDPDPMINNRIINPTIKNPVILSCINKARNSTHNDATPNDNSNGCKNNKVPSKVEHATHPYCNISAIVTQVLDTKQLTIARC